MYIQAYLSKLQHVCSNTCLKNCCIYSRESYSEDKEVDWLQRPLKFTVGVDDSKCSFHAFQFIDAIAGKNDTIKIAHAPDESVLSNINKRYQPFVDKNKKRYTFELIKTKQLDGKPYDKVYEQIMHYINRQNENQVCDFFVTGKFGATQEVEASKSTKDERVGGVADISLRKLQCTSIFVPRLPTVIPDDGQPWIGVVGVDGSKNSQYAFDVAALLLQSGNPEKNKLYVVHVRHSSSANMRECFKPETIKTKFGVLAEQLTKQTKIETEFVMLDGNKVSYPLCEFAESKNAQIIFVGEDGVVNSMENKV